MAGPASIESEAGPTLTSVVAAAGGAQVRVTLQVAGQQHLLGVFSVVGKDIQAVADVDNVDETVADDRVAPDGHLVWPAVESWILDGHRCEWGRRVPSGLCRRSGIGDIDDLQ